MCIVNIYFSDYSLTLKWWIIGLFEVLFFFIIGFLTFNKLRYLPEKRFIIIVFKYSFIIRILYVLFIYMFYLYFNSSPFSFHAADSLFYNEQATILSDFLVNGDYSSFVKRLPLYGFSDLGYIFYLSIIYTISFKSILFVRILKALLSSYSCVLFYKILKNHVDIQISRFAAVLFMFFPYIIYYCGIHLKETEMLFVVIAFIYSVESYFKGHNSILHLFLIFCELLVLFSLRTVLGLSAMGAFIASFLVQKNIKINFQFRLLILISFLVLFYLAMKSKIESEVSSLWSHHSNNQLDSYQWRSKRIGGNKYMKYFTFGVFLFPFILLIPLPTIVEIPNQEPIIQVHASYYIQGILSFFSIYALLLIIKAKKWKEFSFILFFAFMYLGIITLSAFVHSGRFHFPMVWIYLFLGSIGIGLIKKSHMLYFYCFLVGYSILLLIWSWIKLSGRGLI